MSDGFKQSVVNVAEICARHGVRHAVLSPGSRSAPLTLAFLRHPEIACRTVVDERAAGFVALGLAQQTSRPTALVCTSGTAALNYGPAAAEAYYQQIPLLLFTADRPPEWIDQDDGQTLRQPGLYANFVRASYVLPVDDAHPDARWHAERIVSDAVNASQWPVPGPVHVNVPLREPLYPDVELRYEPQVKTVRLSPADRVLPAETWEALLAEWEQAERRLVVAGLQTPGAELEQALSRLVRRQGAALLCDVTSNLGRVAEVHAWDAILGTQDDATLHALAPDLVLSFGGPVVSKNLKLFLRQFKPKAHWRLQFSPQAVDTFQSLTRLLPVSPAPFFARLSAAPSPTARSRAYSETWRELEARVRPGLQGFFENLPHCELAAMHRILNRLPEGSALQLGNSFIVRMANFLGLPEGRRVQVNSNRGVCGIDGTVATAVGAALAGDRLTTLITGDLAFFYDRNAFWPEAVPPNLRIVIINNDGGGIFRLLDGPNRLPELAAHFEVQHGLTAENTARDHGLAYASCDSARELERQLGAFFEPKSKPAILEVHTDRTVNEQTFSQFKAIMREIT